MTAVRDFIDNETLREAWLRTDKQTWAEVGCLAITGKLREADTGVTFGADVANLSDDDLLTLRGELDEVWLRGDRNREDGTVESVVVNLILIVEAELGGRWVS